MDKKFLPDFIPPRLVSSCENWYIEWWELDHNTEQMRRFRRRFMLNRIPGKRKRKAQALRIIQRITEQLTHSGYYGIDPIDQPSAEDWPLIEAIEKAMHLKAQSASKGSRNSYRSMGKIFVTYIRQKRLQKLPAHRFSRREAIRYMDYLSIQKKLGARSYNNHLTYCKSLFQLLIDREYLEKNPFDRIKRKRAKGKNRREFLPDESRTVALWLMKKDIWLFRAIMLQYFCFIRPNEMRQLRFKDFFWKENTLMVPSRIAKARRRDSVTIPPPVKAVFPPDDIRHYPASYYLFASGIRPGKNPCGKNAFNEAHAKHLIHLKNKGKLNNLEGLSFYSWKDSGLTDLGQSIGLLDLMRQARHMDPNETMQYINRNRLNQSFLNLDQDLPGFPS
jgi:integrase